MEKTTLKMLLAGALIAVGTGAAFAQGGPRMDFETLDVDGSGEITIEDMASLRNNRFAELDADGDGSVTREEFTAAQMARASDRAGQMFDRLDVDGDGVLSRDAVESQNRGGGGERMISRLDTDNSGGVSAEEFEEARARFGERRKGSERGFGKKHN